MIFSTFLFVDTDIWQLSHCQLAGNTRELAHSKLFLQIISAGSLYRTCKSSLLTSLTVLPDSLTPSRKLFPGCISALESLEVWQAFSFVFVYWSTLFSIREGGNSVFHPQCLPKLSLNLNVPSQSSLPNNLELL